MMRFAVVAKLVLAATLVLYGGEPERAQHLKQMLMAPCCWAESVAAHNSPLAKEMRGEIDRMVAAGRRDSEIVDHFKARYGRRILVEPDGASGFWLKTIPVVLTILGAVWVILILRRWSRSAPSPERAGSTPLP